MTVQSKCGTRWLLTVIQMAQWQIGDGSVRSSSRCKRTNSSLTLAVQSSQTQRRVNFSHLWTRSLPKWMPVAILVLLFSGWGIFCSNAYFDVPLETVMAFVGGLVFLAGMLTGVFCSFWAARCIFSPELRAGSGMVAPIAVILITAITWYGVIETMLRVEKSLEQRNQYELDHWDELHGTNTEASLP